MSVLSFKSPSLAEEYPKENRYVSVLLWLSLTLLVTGIFSPLMTLTKFIFFKNTISIYSGIVKLFKENEYFLFTVILVFSIIFPISKILLLSSIWYLRWNEERLNKLLNLLGLLGKWSMLDVFVVAFLIVTIKINIISDIKIHFGIYVFSTAIFLSIIVTTCIKKISCR